MKGFKKFEIKDTSRGGIQKQLRSLREECMRIERQLTRREAEAEHYTDDQFDTYTEWRDRALVALGCKRGQRDALKAVLDLMGNSQARQLRQAA